MVKKIFADMNMGSQQMSMGNQFGSSESGQPRVVMVPMMLMPDGSMLPFTNMQQFMTAQVLPQSSSLNESIVALNWVAINFVYDSMKIRIWNYLIILKMFSIAVVATKKRNSGTRKEPSNLTCMTINRSLSIMILSSLSSLDI